MAFRNVVSCYVCDRTFSSRVLTRIDGEGNAHKREISIRRREENNMPPMDISPNSKICLNCNQSILNEINHIEQDPTCLRVNVLSQTRSSSCLICNGVGNLHRLSSDCKAYVFVKKNIYIPEGVKSCVHHLDKRGYILNHLLNDFETFFSVTKLQFQELATYCDRVPCQGGYRYVYKKDLLLFLCKLRQGLSDDFLTVMFQYSTRQSTSLAVSTTFSRHKGRHLVKPALVVAPDGYILEIQGPYFSDTRNNDAAMLQNEFENDMERMGEWFHEGDIFVLDRGYRDATNLLTDLAGAIINRYHPPLVMEGADANMAHQFLTKAQEPNVVQALVEAENLHTRNAGRWVSLAANQLNDFPLLGLDLLKELTTGIYQIKLAPSYIQDKSQRDDDEEFQLEMLRDNDRLPAPGLMRVRVYSRFRNTTKYQLWISYRPIDEDEEYDEFIPINGYYCTCKSGARTFGTCAHIASILWFFGYARHENNIRYPSTQLIQTVQDAAHRLPQENPTNHN
ncbi:hypothetical protein ALC57_18070 [Trachymyrmex cornetzi]|uniref:SWIM-type domain-containing protein n=1 Tax=Trachymyrmex cornetzi TaxID=471704 RepID=A0A151ISR8_9HYME|nr:hypothetical protein ALC57_18070 [Trachymyrmex cornetzi]